MAKDDVIDQVSGEGWTVFNGDAVQVLRKLPDESVHFSIFSPPYISLYVYSASQRDIGNCGNDAEFWEHFGYVIDELFRLIKPGRLVAVDCATIPSMKERDGFIGLKDFRGDLIRAFIARGFVWHSETCVWKDPLVEATRSKALGLMHKQLCKDSSLARAGIPQYLLAFRKPGENAERIAHPHGLSHFAGEEPPVDGVIAHERWRRYASPVWMDINITRTLNVTSARENADERHVCPLALDIIDRALQLWSKRGDVVLSPFGGIGSEGYEAVRAGRRAILIELKPSYAKQAVANLRRAEVEAKQRSLFDDATA